MSHVTCSTKSHMTLVFPDSPIIRGCTGGAFGRRWGSLHVGLWRNEHVRKDGLVLWDYGPSNTESHAAVFQRNLQLCVKFTVFDSVLFRKAESVPMLLLLFRRSHARRVRLYIVYILYLNETVLSTFFFGFAWSVMFNAHKL